MEKVISAFEARRQFGKVLDSVAGKGDSVVVERHGERVAAVVPIRVYEQWRRQREEARERLFESIQQAAERSDLPPEEAEALALEAAFAVRAEAALERSGFFARLYRKLEESDLAPEDVDKFGAELAEVARNVLTRGQQVSAR